MFDSHDIFRASCGDVAPSGLTNPGVGIVLGAGGHPALRLMVDEHERLHMELNCASAFGVLLGLVGAGAFELQAADASALLTNLIRLCRTTHEVYATTLSITAVPADQRHAAMEHYPQYKRYLAIGRALTCGYDQSTLVGSALVVGPCIACMQVPLNAAMTHDRDWYAKPLALRSEDTPDSRLDRVRRMLRRGEIEFGWIREEVDPRWMTGRTADPYGSPEYKDMYHEVLIRIYHQYGSALANHGMPVVRWDSHHRYLEDGLQADDVGVFRSADIADDELAALKEATAAKSRRTAPIAAAEFQVLQRPTYQRPAFVVSLDGLDRQGAGAELLHLFDHAPPHPGFHIVVRPVEAVIAAYDLQGKQADELRRAATGGVLTALRTVRSSSDGSPLTILCVMRSNGALDDLVEACVRDPALTPQFVSTISLWSLFSARWREEWLTGLRHLSHPVLVGDVSTRLLAALEADPDGFSYQRVLVTSTEGPPAADSVEAIAVERNGAERTVERYSLIFGSGVLISNLELRLAELPGALMSESLMRTPVGIAMSYLAIAEPEFGALTTTAGLEPSPPSEPVIAAAQWERWLSLQRRLHDHQVAMRSRPPPPRR